MSLRLLEVPLVVWTVVCLGVGCGHSPKGATIEGDAPSEAPSPPDPPDFLSGNDGGTENLGCDPQSCVRQGKDCGEVVDGCGGTLDCGQCAEDALCGVVTANVCTPLVELCRPAAREAVCDGKECGVEGDGCGGSVDCGSCPDGQTCGSERAFTCGAAPLGSPESCPARIESCAEAGAECGLIGNGCGGTIDCGGCGGGELCGVDAPHQCGAAPVCEPLEP